METNFTQRALDVFAVVAVVLALGFLFYGFLKGIIIEKDFKLRNRRKYS